MQKPEEIDSIFVKSDYKLVQVDLKKIMYIEGLKDYIKIYTEDASKPILSLMSMKAMEELLPSSRFIRVHRSFIVQKDKIRVIDRGRIVFDKTYIPISDSYKQVFQAFLDERSWWFPILSVKTRFLSIIVCQNLFYPYLCNEQKGIVKFQE